MKEELISYKTAKLAKEKGFNERCESGYKYTERVMKNPNQKFAKNSELLNEGCTAPSQGILQKWLREQHNIDISIITNYNLSKVEINIIENIKSYRCGIIYIKDNELKTFFIRPDNFTLTFVEFKTYEEALEEGIYQALKLIK